MEESLADSGEGERPRGRSASFSSLVCAPHVPAHPGRSCREEREYQFLRHLMALSTVQLFSHRPAVQQPPGHRAAPADALYTPVTLSLFRPDLVSLLDTRPRLRTRVATGLRRQRLPILGPSCPVQVTQEFLHVRAFARPALQDALDRQEPDFLFVMPQTNPVALTLATRQARSRLVLLAHRVEKDAMRWLAETRHGLASWAYSLEAGRAHRFERRNLSRFDGVIVAGEEERQRLAQEYGYPAERILVVPQGVDAAHWASTPRGRPEQVVVFHGSFQDERTRAAALRLVRGVWPLVASAQAEAELWLLNSDAEYPLPISERAGIRVLHQVNDVRLQLGRAAAVCLPLPAGGGREGPVLETLASAVPLVCTAAAAATVPAAQDGVHLLVGHTDADLAASVCRLFEDESLGERLGRSGRELAREHPWEKCLAPLGDWLKQIAGLPQFRHRRGQGQLRAG
jgi:glycosyltransferase involved in cell wall biosynthesis